MAKDISNLSDDIRVKLREVLTLTGMEGTSKLVLAAPADTGLMRTKIGFSVDVREESQLIFHFPTYAKYVEYGTAPHKVSPRVLEAWAKRHGINPFALANHIKKFGTRPHPFIRPFLFFDLPGIVRKYLKEMK